MMRENVPEMTRENDEKVPEMMHEKIHEKMPDVYEKRCVNAVMGMSCFGAAS